MDRNGGRVYIEVMNWWKKIKLVFGGVRRDKWVESQIRGMAKLRGKLILMV